MLYAGAKFFGFERRFFGFVVSSSLLVVFASVLLFAEQRWRRGGARGVCCGAGALITVVPGRRHERERTHAEEKERFRLVFFEVLTNGGAQKGKKTSSEDFVLISVYLAPVCSSSEMGGCLSAPATKTDASGNVVR